jgi:hypothetical protein
MDTGTVFFIAFMIAILRPLRLAGIKIPEPRNKREGIQFTHSSRSSWLAPTRRLPSTALVSPRWGRHFKKRKTRLRDERGAQVSGGK